MIHLRIHIYHMHGNIITTCVGKEILFSREKGMPSSRIFDRSLSALWKIVGIARGKQNRKKQQS